jgi:hypothetical protein
MTNDGKTPAEIEAILDNDPKAVIPKQAYNAAGLSAEYVASYRESVTPPPAPSAISEAKSIIRECLRNFNLMDIKRGDTVIVITITQRFGANDSHITFAVTNEDWQQLISEGYIRQHDFSKIPDTWTISPKR